MQDFLTKRFWIGAAILGGALGVSLLFNEMAQAESNLSSSTGPGYIVPSVREGTHHSRGWSRSGWSSGK